MASSINDPAAETDRLNDGNAEQLRLAADESFSGADAVKRAQVIFKRHAHLQGASVDDFLRNRRLNSGN